MCENPNNYFYDTYIIYDKQIKENRPDISILHSIISGSSRDFIDVAITDAMSGSEHGIIEPPNNRSVVATEQGRQAHQQARFKIN